MNANEVISNRAIEILGGDRFEAEKADPSERSCQHGAKHQRHVPHGHSRRRGRQHPEATCPGLEAVARRAGRQGRGSGTRSSRSAARTWPTPRRCGWDRNSAALPGRLELSIERAERAQKPVLELPAGGTAVGTGINTHPEFGRRVAAALAKETGIPFVEAANHFEANAQRDGLVECHGQLRTIASTLFNVANNIRWLGSGPRCGFYEVKLPDRQPGSSIMPGKVNPVMCESMMQVAARVMGNDQTIRSQRNGRRPVPTEHHDARDGTRRRSKACSCWPTSPMPSSISAPWRWKPTPEACEASVEKSLSMVTSLNPHIGYEKAARLAKEAFKTGKTIRELCREKHILPETTLNEALDPLAHDGAARLIVL